MDVTHILEGLNAKQREAVNAEAGHYLVLAGAGSGKTRVLVHRMAWLHEVENVPAWGMLAVTFTNKAAGEMRARVADMLRGDVRGLWIGTFHGLAHRWLRLHFREAELPEGFQVIDSDDQQRLIKRIINDLGLDESRYPARQVQWFINGHKDEGKRAKHIQGGHIHTDEMLKVFAAYDEACQRSGLVDFAELLLRTHEMFLKHPALLAHYQQRFGHLLVDEFQDTNAIQYALIRILAGDTGRVFVVGDDDQAIYGWRGAKVEHVQRFLKDFPGATTLRLEQNYRSTDVILKAANAVIANNPARMGKTLWTEDAAGDLIDVYAAYSELDEASWITQQIGTNMRHGDRASEHAILYRANALSRVMEEALIAASIPYRVYGGLKFFERAEIKDALAYLRLITNHADDAAFERAVNQPPRGIGAKTLDAVRQHARANGLTLWDGVCGLLAQGGLTSRASGALRDFLAIIVSLKEHLADLNLSEQIDHVIQRVGLRDYFDQQKSEQSIARVENLDELISVAARFVRADVPDEDNMPELVAFLAYAALEAGEGQASADEDSVQLMTLHAAKGLEFKHVFVVGMEDGLFPSQRSMGEGDRLEEERRLAYVGITRAREKLSLSYAESRRLHGQDHLGIPSRFLREIPKELIHDIRPKVPRRGSQFHGGMPRQRFVVEDSLPGGFRLGQNVRHAKFGDGVITDMEGSGAHTNVHVAFEDVGTKILVLAYAKLEAI